MKFEEEEVRGGEWTCVETQVTKAGEIDIYHAAEVPGLEIRIQLARDAAGGSVCYSSTMVVGANGGQITILDEDGRKMDREAMDVMAYEMIEYTPSAVAYMSGREAVTDEEGNSLPIGGSRIWEREEVGEPSFA
ncbi:hypothetical protein ACEUZ9_004676 [Paracoccus litorisediminis]|uniref:hypothetical protein n=1 Tax=Paracoccus litorisediminis TaxID=2006130 RepID=UPI0037346E41